MNVVLYGARQDGHAKVCLRALQRLGWDCAGCVVDASDDMDVTLDGLPVLGDRGVLAGLRDRGVDGVVLGFGDGAGRRALLEPVRAAGLQLPALIDPEARQSGLNVVGEGAVVLAGALLGDDVFIGEAALVNAGAILTHDVHVGDGASVGPGAVLSGRTRIGRDAQLGSGVVLLPDVVVGDGAVVGAGAVVTREIAAGTTAVGVPARPVSPPPRAADTP
jgi:sugar O-acyltransferase (sialic acid O-acetyltransferase NeuD family)